MNATSVAVNPLPLKGNPTPRIATYREGNGSFYDLVREMADEFGLTPFPWQEKVLKIIYAIDIAEDGSWDWANKIVCVSSGRQPGKGRLAEIVELADIFLFGASYISHTAQGANIANTGFKKMRTLLNAYNRTAGEDAILFNPIASDGRQVIRFTQRESLKNPHGVSQEVLDVYAAEQQEIKYLTRSSDKIQGDSLDTLVVDEAQHLTVESWEEIFPTLSARPNSRALLIGNPPKGQADDQFRRFRTLALKHIEEGTSAPIAWVEYSADAEWDVNDPVTWVNSHPGIGYAISMLDFIAFKESSTDEESFKRSFLGMWDIDTSETVIPMSLWNRQANADISITGPLFIGCDFDFLRKNAAVTVAGKTDDGRVKVQVAMVDEGTTWVVDYISELIETYGEDRVRGVVVDKFSGARDLEDDFAQSNIRLTITEWTQLVKACNEFEGGILNGSVLHAGERPLTEAMQGAAWKTNTEGGGRRWDRRKASSPLYTLMAATLSVWAANEFTRAPKLVKRPRRPERAEPLRRQRGRIISSRF